MGPIIHECCRCEHLQAFSLSERTLIIIHGWDSPFMPQQRKNSFFIFLKHETFNFISFTTIKDSLLELCSLGFFLHHACFFFFKYLHLCKLLKCQWESVVKNNNELVNYSLKFPKTSVVLDQHLYQWTENKSHQNEIQGNGCTGFYLYQMLLEIRKSLAGA